jgi:hypothetical protein
MGSILQNFHAELRDLGEIYDVLTKDLKRVLEVSEQKNKELKNGAESALLDEQGTWFRLINRITLSTIEAVCYKLKQIALLSYDIKGPTLNAKERQKLEEKREDGKPYFMPTDDNVKFAFKMFANAFGSSYKLDCSGEEWVNFCRLVAKRNAITHPKTSADLKISPEEHDKAADAAVWFGRAFRELTSVTVREIGGLTKT